MKTPDVAENAIKGLSGIKFNGKMLKCSWGKPKQEDYGSPAYTSYPIHPFSVYAPIGYTSYPYPSWPHTPTEHHETAVHSNTLADDQNQSTWIPNRTPTIQNSRKTDF